MCRMCQFSRWVCSAFFKAKIWEPSQLQAHALRFAGERSAKPVPHLGVQHELELEAKAGNGR